jgi:putative tricarboxylic transport membrane protein
MKEISGLTGWVLALAAALALSAGTAWGQAAWRPDKPVEIVTPSAAGGSNDRVARMIQKIVQEEKLVPVPVSVINKPGGNQTLSRAHLQQHPGDAHYFDIGNPTLISNHIRGITPQQFSDFTAIALLINEYTVFTVRSDSPMRNVKDLIARLKADPESMSIGVSNLGGTNHLTLSMAAKAGGVDPRKLKVVVFKTNAESTTALMGAHIQLVASSVPSVIGQVKAGTVRAIAIGDTERMSGILAAVPTLREQGIDVSLSNWRAVIGPKGLTPAQVGYWENVLARVVATDEWKNELAAQNWDGRFLRSKEFTRYMEKEYAATKIILNELGLVK